MGLNRIRPVRGMTLLEMMVVVAILGVIAALAVPQMLTMVKLAKLSGDAEEVATFLESVRRRARAEQRCMRVLQSGNQLVVDARDSADCVNLATDGWTVNVLSLQGGPGTTFSLGAGDALPAGLPADERMIFRPNGRLRGDADLIIDDDIARVVVGQAGIPHRTVVLVTGSLRVCTIPGVAAPAALAATTRCL